MFLHEGEAVVREGVEEVVAFFSGVGWSFEEHEDAIDGKEFDGVGEEIGGGADGSGGDHLALLVELGVVAGDFAAAEGVGLGVGAGGEFDGFLEEGGFAGAAVDEDPLAVGNPGHEGQAGVAAAGAEVEDDVAGGGVGFDQIADCEGVEDMEFEVVEGGDEAGEIEPAIDAGEVAVDGLEA